MATYGNTKGSYALPGRWTMDDVRERHCKQGELTLAQRNWQKPNHLLDTFLNMHGHRKLRSADWNTGQSVLAAIPYHTPGTFDDNATWRPAGVSQSQTSMDRPSSKISRFDEYDRRYRELSQKVAYRYPDPGVPRERQGRIGGTWRHIKEVLGHGGSRVVFIDGLVSQYDSAKVLNGSKYLRDRLAGPSYAPTGPHSPANSYNDILQRDMGPWSEPKSAPPCQPPTLGDLPVAPIPPPSPQTSRYKGFYRYK